MGISSSNKNKKEEKKENDNIKHIYIDINLKDSNILNQESTEDRIQNGNSYSASQQLNSNINENKIGNASNEYSIFNSTNFKQEIGKEIENETKKGNIDPFSGGQIDQNPTIGNSPTKKDNVDIFSGGQIEKDTPENTTKGRNIDINMDRSSNYENLEKLNKDNNIDNSNINISSIDNSNINNNIYNSNIDNNNINNSNIDNSNIKNDNIDNNNIKDNIEDNKEEDEKIFTNDRFEEDKKENINEENDENDEQTKISKHFEKIKNICEKEGKFPFFLKFSENNPELLLTSKNHTLRSILKMKNIDDRNISIFCRENQVSLDETFENQNLKNFCIIEINEVF